MIAKPEITIAQCDSIKITLGHDDILVNFKLLKLPTVIYLHANCKSEMCCAQQVVILGEIWDSEIMPQEL